MVMKIRGKSVELLCELDPSLKEFVVMEKVIAKGYHSRFSSPTNSERAPEDEEISVDIDQSEAEL